MPTVYIVDDSEVMRARILLEKEKMDEHDIAAILGPEFSAIFRRRCKSIRLNSLGARP